MFFKNITVSNIGNICLAEYVGFEYDTFTIFRCITKAGLRII